MNRFKPHFLIILLTTAALFSACKKDENKKPGTTITVGVLLPLTGAGASPGESGNEAVKQAVLDINAYFSTINSEDILQVIIEDTQTDTTITIEKYIALKEKGVQLIVGPYSSANLDALKTRAAMDGILIVSPASVANTLAIAGDNIFRLIPSVASQGEALAYLLEDDDIQVLIPVVRDDIWGDELLEATSQYFLKNENQITEPIKYAPVTSDFNPVITQLLASTNNLLQSYAPENIGIYLLTYGEGYEILKLAASENFPTAIPWYGNSAFAENKTIVEDTQTSAFAGSRNLACPTFGLDQNARTKWEPLLNQLKNTMGRKPEIYAFTTYDALWIAALSYQSLNENPEISLLKNNFTFQANNFYGTSGWTTLNEFGDRSLAIYDFWGITNFSDAPKWAVIGRFNNTTKELSRY